MTRAITDDALVETVLATAGVSPGGELDVPYRGRPLSVRPVGANGIFFVMWPAVTAGLWIVWWRRQS
jgi:hypothetical protein